MKILISSDWHIGDYADYNYSFRSRLGQFSLLSKRLIEIADQYGCEEHWILGDILDKPAALSYIVHVAQRCIGEQCSHFKNVRYILGQHDLISKSEKLSVDDSLVNLFDYPNFIYMDHKTLNIDNHLYGFQTWRPEQDLSWLGDSHLDVLFAHYTKSTLFGQDIDDSKFDLCIHGDIHSNQEIGKFISVGNPIQKDMSSLEDGDVLIFDTETNKWDRILTDQDKTRFLRIRYTQDRSVEGFQSPLLYNIYRPDITSNLGESIKKSITWDDMDSLIHNVCSELDLLSIHDEVSSKVGQYNEIDFNFQLNSITIHGFRSIVDMHLDFNKGDQIALLGDNGSGKSSVLTALREVLMGDNPSVRHNNSDFTDNDCWVSVELTYQNKVYKITKGTEYGFNIDGKELSYNRVLDMYADIKEKLPFINYLDIFFIKAGSSNLDNQLTSDRRIELISKFYRFDRIKAYYDTAMQKVQELNSEFFGLKEDYNVKLGILDKLKVRFKEIEDYKDKSLEDLTEVRDEYLKIKDRYYEYKLWSNQVNDVTSGINICKDKISKLKSVTDFDLDKGESDLKDLKDKASLINKQYEELRATAVEFENDLKEILQLESTGHELSCKLEKLKTGVCPECGTPLSDGKSKSLIDNIESELSELRDKWTVLDNKIYNNPDGRNSKQYYLTALKALKDEYTNISQGIELLDNKVKNHIPKLTQLDSESKRLVELQDKLKSLNENKMERVTVPLDLTDKINNATADIAKYNECQDRYREITELQSEVDNMKSKLEQLDIVLTKWNKYSEVMDLNGIIYEQLLKQLADKFSTTEISYDVSSEVYRGVRHIYFYSYYVMKSGRKRIYDTCSSGQKIICDLDFLSKLFSVQVGLLVMDEYLKHLDEKNFPKACDILSHMNVNTIVLSTHDDNLTSYNRKINLRLNESDQTVVESEKTLYNK
jgi:DNA repair exonuclease SbcCD ATPase subunit